MNEYFWAKIEDGQINWSNKNAIGKFLAVNEGKKITIEIKEDKPNRSLNQNALYWSYLRIISDETGHTAQELHEIFKRLFLQPRFITYQGRDIKLPGSTTNINKADMHDYLERISAHTGVPVPNPYETP